MNINKLKNLFEVSYIKSFMLNDKFKSLVFPRVHLGLMNGCKVLINGKLRLGKTWNGLGYFPSQLKVES